jgi:hypothetical protein
VISDYNDLRFASRRSPELKTGATLAILTNEGGSHVNDLVRRRMWQSLEEACLAEE